MPTLCFTMPTLCQPLCTVVLYSTCAIYVDWFCFLLSFYKKSQQDQQQQQEEEEQLLNLKNAMLALKIRY